MPVIFYQAGTTTFTVPAGFNLGEPWSLEAIGAGGVGYLSHNPGGGAGGMYARITQNDATLVAGQTVYCSIGAGSTTVGHTGADTWANISANSVPATPSAGALAKGGGAGASGSGGAAPAAGLGIGSTINVGGRGG